MRKKGFIFLLLLSIESPHVWAWDRPELAIEKYSEGYQVGRIVKVSRRGWPIKSSEIEVQVGDVGGEVVIYKRPLPKELYTEVGENNTPEDAGQLDEARRGWERENAIMVTPWQFSSLHRQQPIIENYINQVSMIHFFQRRIKDPFLETNNEWVDQFNLSQRNFKPLAYQVVRGAHNEYAQGTRFGRIVKIAYQGSPFIKTWECIVQLGDKGRSFVAMSIRDHYLARYAALAMQSGALLRLEYTQTGSGSIDVITRVFGERSPFAMFRYEESEYDIYKIEQTLFPGTKIEDLKTIPSEVYMGYGVRLDSYLHDYLGG